MFNPVYVGVAAIGLLHGLEPGHGWPVAVLYSMNKSRPFHSAVVSSGIIGAAHLVSSIAVVVAYVLLQEWLNFEALWIKYLAAGILLILAFKLFRESTHDWDKQHGHIHKGQPKAKHAHEHEHPGEGTHTHWHEHATGIALSLWGLATFAFILGFAHEEEFALLALVAGGADAWVLMFAYGISVLVGLVVVTLLGVRVYKYLQHKFIRYQKYLPKIGGAALVVMAVVIVLW